ncbi:YfeC-like transcriptional regulator [Escherichia coli]
MTLAKEMTRVDKYSLHPCFSREGIIPSLQRLGIRDSR